VVTSGTLVNPVGGTIDVGGNANSLTAPLDNQGTVTINASFSVAGQLTVPLAAAGTFNGNGSTLSVIGVDIDGAATFDNVPLITTNGTIGAFDNVTFQNMDVAATQLTINHPGAATPFTFNNTVFNTTPTTGLYISVTDNGGVNTLTINLTASTPADGSAFTATAGGAVVNW
jgi:hypothetical protein